MGATAPILAFSLEELRSKLRGSSLAEMDTLLWADMFFNTFLKGFKALKAIPSLAAKDNVIGFLGLLGLDHRAYSEYETALVLIFRPASSKEEPSLTL